MKETISTSEIGKRLGVDRCRIEKMLRQGKFPFGFAMQSDTGTKTRWRYICPKAAFEHYMKYGTCPVSVVDIDGEKQEKDERR